MTLIDELNDAGAADHSDTTEYKNKTLYILKQRNDKKRPSIYLIENFDDVIELDDYICQTVMPYGLAAHLMLDENPTVAAFCQQRYEELKAGLQSGIPCMSQDIVDVYAGDGGGYYDANGDWISGGGTGLGFEWTTRW